MHQSQDRTPYSVSYLSPPPAKVAGKHGSAWPAEYVQRVQGVFNRLTNLRARAAFYAVHYQIVGHHDELEGLLYNAPPHWDDKTLTATEIDGTVIEKFTPPAT